MVSYWRLAIQLGATTAAMIAAAAGLSLESDAVAIAACLALLVLGLPHGSFDVLLIAGAGGGAWRARAWALIVYVGLAAMMTAVWLTAPAAALAVFLAIAVVHFAEDWSATGSTFMAQGVALALIAGPTFLHGPAIAGLLGAVTSPPIGAVAAAALTTVAPVATIVALVGLGMIWRQGESARAVSGAFALAGMLLLPPLVGFALFFCLLHSPLHFAAAQRDAHRESWRRWAPVVLPVTLAALGVAGAMLLIGRDAGLAPGLVQASFRTLSILTLPHVLAPAILRRWPLWSRRSAHRGR